MKRFLTFLLIFLGSTVGGLLVLAFYAVLEAFHAYDRSRGVVTGAKVSKDAKERFYADLQEQEFRVINVGPTVFPKGH
jgi:hypothetical protein